MGDASLPLQLDPQGLKRLYRDYLKFVLLSATPEQRMQILSRERAALTRKDASPTDGTGRVDRYTQRIRGSFDQEDLTDALIEWAVSPPSLALPAASATEARPVARAGAVIASTPAAAPIPGFVHQREGEAPQLPQRAPLLLPESAARMKEWLEYVKRDRQDAATRPSVSGPPKANDEPEHTNPKRPGQAEADTGQWAKNHSTQG
jgi:hypothetical protein